ncbi:hypothetical protein [Dongia rigui]|uniref:Lipoprotein n=1 Tax=Dongia rigui TaxID=940149 RepID=A0ABU5E493_9PROT|nr:hypothetical protein [Dongia rigui]MDY0874356.1 hypothetical protein [Dongia rigui]
MNTATLHLSATMLAIMLCGCVGEDDAQRLAAKASTGVNDLKLHVDRTIGDYQFARAEDYDRLSALQAMAVDTESQTNARMATWEVTGDKSKSDLLKTYKAMTPKAALSASAAALLIQPVPPFQPPSLDEKAMNSLVAKLGSLAKDPTLVDRLVDATDYFLKVQAAYGKTVEAAKKKPGGSAAVGKDKADTSDALVVSMSKAVPDKVPDNTILTSYLDATAVQDVAFQTQDEESRAALKGAAIESISVDAMQWSFMGPTAPKPALPSQDFSGRRNSAPVTDLLIQNLFQTP